MKYNFIFTKIERPSEYCAQLMKSFMYDMMSTDDVHADVAHRLGK